jgi:hypothetical protein
MNYENKEMVDHVDKVSGDILVVKNHMHHRDRFFPALIDQLGLKVGVEVGVDRAEFSEHLLSRSNIEKLHCIDTWMDNFGSNYKPEEYDPKGENRMKEALERLNKFGVRGNAIKATSVEAANSFHIDKIDFCYIDGDHTFEGVYVDIRAWLPKVRIGGIIAGHDYKDGPKSGINDCFGQQLPFGVKTVVDGFCQRYGYPLRVVGGRILSWFFVKNKEVEDPLGVYAVRG